MRGKIVLTIVLVLSAYLFGACRTNRPPETAPSGPPPDTRPCVANLSMEGSFFSGRTVKTFQEYPNTSKGAAFTYLISKISSIGYKISTSDRESGLISASYQVTAGQGETTSLNAVVTGRSPTGVRVDLTFTTGGMVSFSLDEAKKEFCSILEGVPTEQKKSPDKPKPKPPEEVKPAPPQPESKQPPPPKSSLRKRVVIVPSEKLRQTPDGKVIGKASKGTSLEILEEKGDWLRVRLEDGTKAWIWKASTAEDSTKPSTPIKKGPGDPM